MHRNICTGTTVKSLGLENATWNKFLRGENLYVHHKKFWNFYDVSGAVAVCVRAVTCPDLLHTILIRLGRHSRNGLGRRRQWELIRDNVWVRGQTEWADLRNHTK